MAFVLESRVLVGKKFVLHRLRKILSRAFRAVGGRVRSYRHFDLAKCKVNWK
jgi:hypothetical protein